jgi:hypothetical protein
MSHRRRSNVILLLAALLLPPLHAAVPEPSPFERPPGMAEVDWKALQQALAKSITPAQTLRPQDETTFGQGDGTSFMQFGRSIAVSGTTLVLGAPSAVACTLTTSSCAGGVGAAYIYERVAGAWQFRQKLFASDYSFASTTNRTFGASVAIDGDTLLVGAGGALDPVAAPNNAIGAVYVFTRTAGTWSQVQKLLPPTPVIGTDEFGFSVALSGDTAVIGNPGRIVAGAERAGAVHVFTRSSGSFTQSALLTASDPAAGNRLGYAVAYSGSSILAGAPLGDAPALADTGAAYVFTGSGANWAEQAKLIANDPLAAARFGHSVDLEGDSAVLGAVGWASNQGRAYVFVRTGTTWAQQQRLDAGDTNANRMGESVSIRGDQVAVGAPDTREPVTQQGAVRLFTRSAGTWTLEQSLLGPAMGSFVQLGVAVRLFDDGGTPALLASTGSNLPGSASGVEALRTYRRTGKVPTPFVIDADLTRLPSTTQAFLGAVIAVEGDLAVVGAPGMQQPRGAGFTDFIRVGAVYVYARNGGQWTLRQALTIVPLGGDPAAFGSAVAISGSTIAVGAPGERATLAGSGTGAAYVYVVGPTSIELQQRIAIDNVSGSNNAFGRSLALDGDTLAVGAPFTSNAGPPNNLADNFGRVFVYTRSGTTWTKQQEIVDASPPGTSDDFGNYVILRGNAMVIGSRRSVTSGYVPYVALATRTGSTWNIVQRILEPPGSSIPFAGGEFGQSLAFDGSTLAIGAGRHGNEGGSNGNGRVYLYEGAPGTFAPAQTLRQTDATITSVSSRFGAALALGGDRLLVSAPDTNFAGGTGPIGSAYAYERDGGAWRLAARLRAAAPDATTFGFSGPLTGIPAGGTPLAYAGEQVLIGIPRSNGQAPFSAQNVGAAAVYEVPRRTTLDLVPESAAPLVNAAVRMRVTLVASSGAIPSGEVLVSASSGESCSATAASGQCTITFLRAGYRSLVASYAGAPGFGQSRSRTVGIEVGTPGLPIVAEQPLVPESGDSFDLTGSAVAMNERYVVVGAPSATSGGSLGRGAVYVFERGAVPPAALASAKAIAGLIAAKSLERVATLTNASGSAGDKWGSAVAISPDGGTIVIGAPGAGNNLGQAVAFEAPVGGWVDDATPDLPLTPAPGAGETLGEFGAAVSIDAAGRIVIGAPASDRPGSNDAGAAFVFDDGGVQRGALAAATPAAGDRFGASVAIASGSIAIGAPNDDIGSAVDRGSVSTFTTDGSTVTAGPVLNAGNGAGGDKWGTSVSLSPTGGLLAVGAPGARSGVGSGTVLGASGATFTELATLEPTQASGVRGAGQAIAITEALAVLGAPESTGTDAQGNSVGSAGAAAVFATPSTGWSGARAPDGVLRPALASGNERYGIAVAASGTGIVIGAPGTDLAVGEGPVQTDIGFAVSYVFDRLFVDGFE